MTENTRVCPNCGAKNPAAARFCGYCGAPMEGAGYRPPTAALPGEEEPTPPPPPNFGTPPSTPPSFEQAPLPPVTPPPGARTGGPIPPPPYSAATPPQPPPRRSNILIPVIIIVVVVCLLCACVAIVLGLAVFPSYRSRSMLPLPGNLPLPIEVTPPAIQIPELTRLTPEVIITAISGDEIQSTAEAVATQVAEGLSTLTAPQVSSPTQASATATDEGTASGMKVFTDDHVTLTYDRMLAADILAETVPEAKGADVAPWDVGPEYQRYTLQGYPLEGSQHQPQVFIYPVADYVKLVPDVQKRVDALKTVLKNHPANVQSAGALPFLPYWNAAPILIVQTKYFPNGVRFIAKFGQDVSPVTNMELFYTYQGLTPDGKYWVAAILPVSTSMLPNAPAIGGLSGSEYDQFMQGYNKYIADLIAKFNKQQPNDFRPNLNLLDDFAQSIQVQ